MQTKKLGNIFMVGVLSVLLLTFGGFQSAYAAGGRGAPANPSKPIGYVHQLRLNQPMKLLGPKTPSGKQYVGNQSKLRRPTSKYSGLK